MLSVDIQDDIVTINARNDEVTHANIVETLSFFVENPSAYRGKKLLIVDHGSHYDPSKVELQEFVSLVKSILGSVFPRIALVVPRAFHFGLGRMVEVFADTKEGEFRVFKDEQSARVWFFD